MAQPTEKAALREQRLAEGLCPECGTRLYEVVKRNRRSTIKTLFNKKDKDQTDDGVKMVPLTLPGVVERGQCMKCCLSSPVGGMDDDTPAVKAVPVTVKSPGAAYAHTGEDSETEDLLGMMESDNKSNDSSFRGSFSDFGRSDTGNSIYSTDTEYDDVPAMDMANMDLNDPVSSRGGVRYAHSDSAGLDDDLLAPIPDHNLNSHFAAIPPAAAAAQDPDQQKMPSKPEPLDCPDGMNPDVFYQLPPEVQKEVSQQRSDIDPDVLASLPVHLRQEVLDQARNKSGRKGSVSFAQNDEQERVKKKKTALDRKSLSKSTKEFLLGYDIGEDEFDELDEDVQVDLLAQKPKTNTRAEMMKSSLSKSTIGFLAGFDINEADFESLDEDVKKDLLAEKNKSSSNRSSISGPCVASEVGLDSQYDPELLASLPEDLRNELLEEERQKRGRDDSQRSRNSRNSVGAHSVNIPAGYDPDTFEALPLEMQQELMEAANGGIVYSADGYGNDSIARAPVVSAHAAGQEKATYEGEYNDAGKRHGEGTLTWRNGDVYVGWFKNGFMEGRGTITFHDGTEYSGQWHKNKFNGMGTRRFKNGNVYTGNYVDGKRQGQGKCFFANGDLYSGDWKNDTIQGFGRYYYNNGHCFEGMFRNGQRNGRGKYQLTDGRVEIYRYVNDSRVGDGVRWSADRKKAWKMNGGKVVKRISMDDATAIANRCGPVLEES